MIALEVTNLSYKYVDGTMALDQVSFSIFEGERVALIGPNGAGKSTLLLHFNGILPGENRDNGAVKIFGQTIARSNLAKIRSEVGLMFQDPDDQLFCSSVWEDVSFGPRQLGLREPELSQRVRAALDEAGVMNLDERQPHHLSRGQKRRVCLAGLLACNVRLLVLDEPTSDLDPRGRRELKALLCKLPATQIIATHDLEMAAEICSRVIVLDDGKIVAQGPVHEILSDEAVMLAHGLERPHNLRGTTALP